MPRTSVCSADRSCSSSRSRRRRTTRGESISPENVHYACEHHDIIERFGRFPHRNRILGRESTEEELAYLADGAPSFGQ